MRPGSIGVQPSLREFVAELRSPMPSTDARPKVSIVMPSYNQGPFIERSILSVLNQGYPNLELIVIDGGSNDATTEVLKAYDQHITCWVSEPDCGQSDALNKGFARATGDIFGWLNSDDLYLPGAIEAAVRRFQNHSRATVVYGDFCNADINDQITGYMFALDFSLGHLVYEGFLFNAQSMFWSRDAHKRFGDFDIRLHLTMDYDFMVRLGKNERRDAFVRIPDVALGCFRRYDGQKTEMLARGKVDPRVVEEHRLIAEKNGLRRKFSRTGAVLRGLYRTRRAYWYLRRGGVAYLKQKARVAATTAG